VTLVGSNYAAVSGFSGPGSITSLPLFQGAIALDRAGSSIIIIPAQGSGGIECVDTPYYSSDFGQSWSKMTPPVSGRAWPLTSGISSSSLASGTLTINTNIPHGLIAGQPVQLIGTGTSADSGPKAIATVPTSTSFTINSITGSITANGLIRNGWPGSGKVAAQVVAADRHFNDTFYLANYIYGLFKSVSGGTVTNISTDGQSGSFILRAVPGSTTGELFGQAVAPQNNYITYPSGTGSLNYWNGSSWHRIPNAINPICFDIGPSRPGAGGYPTVWCAKWSSATGTYAVQYSTNANTATPTWSSIGGQDYPNNSSAYPQCIVCDQDKWNQVFVGYNTSSFAWYNGDGT
jgi:hypothetical protein